MSNKVTRQAKQISQNNIGLTQQSISVSRTSILPPPEEMAQYEKLHKGFTEEMLNMVKKQVDHRISLEKLVITSGVNNSKRGQLLAFILALVVVIGGFILIIKGKDITGIAAILLALASLLAVFMYGSKKKEEERIQKEKINAQ